MLIAEEIEKKYLPLFSQENKIEIKYIEALNFTIINIYNKIHNKIIDFQFTIYSDGIKIHSSEKMRAEYIMLDHKDYFNKFINTCLRLDVKLRPKYEKLKMFI